VFRNILESRIGRLLGLHVFRKKTGHFLLTQSTLGCLTAIENSTTTTLKIESPNIILLHDPEDHLFHNFRTLLLLLDLVIQILRFLLDLTPSLNHDGKLGQFIRIGGRGCFRLRNGNLTGRDDSVRHSGKIYNQRFRPTLQICEAGVATTMYPMNDLEVEEGIEILEALWFLLANRIVEMAIQVYKLDSSQASALREVYLKQNNYYVVLRT